MSEQEFRINEQEFQDFQALMQRLETAETNDFLELATLLGRNPKTDLIGADLSGTDLSSADLSSANLSGADLSNANLSNANLSGADLREANLYRSNLSRANLDGATVRGAQFGDNLGLSESTELDLKKRGALLNGSMSNLSTSIEEAPHETRKPKQHKRHSTSQVVEMRESNLGPAQVTAAVLSQPNVRHLPQRIAARLEASDGGVLRVVYGGTSWRFKLLVSMGQIIQLLPGQTVTIVGVEDTTTLIIEV